MADNRHQKTKMTTPASGVNPVVDIAQAIQEGRAPSTAEVSQVLEKTERALDEQKIASQDEKTRQLVRDTQNVLGATKELLEKKNAGEKLQNIISESALATQSAESFYGYKSASLTAADKQVLEEMRKRLLDAAVVGRDILRLIIFNPQFREALVNIANIAQEVFFNVAEKVQQQPAQAPKTKKAKKAKEAAKSAAQSKRTEADRRQLNQRIHTMLSQMKDNETYQRGVSGLFSLADMIRVSAEKVGEKVDRMEVELATEEHAQKALKQSKELAEEFLPGDKTLDPLLQNLKNLILSIRKDKALSNYIKRWREIIETSFRQPNKLTDENFRSQIEKLAEDGEQVVMRPELRDAGQKVLNEWREVLENFKQDEQVNMLNLTLQKLMADITKRDEKGRTTLDMHAISSLRPILVELLRKNLDKIPLPDIEGEDETYKYSASNIVASGSDILPDYIEIDTSTRSEAAIKDTSRPTWLRGDLLVRVQNIRTKLENVKFWYYRKSFPSGEDSGYMDIDVAGGVTVVIKLHLQSDDSGNFSFSEGSVYCRADDVRVKLRETKHDWIYNLFSGMWAEPIKENIERYIAEKLADAIKDFKDAANQRVAEFQKMSLSAAVPQMLQSTVEQVTA